MITRQEAIKRLADLEREIAELKKALEEKWDETPEDSELSQRAKSQIEFLNRLKAKGLIKDIPQKGLEKIPAFAPIKVKGKPVSQTIIEDRGRE